MSHEHGNDHLECAGCNGVTNEELVQKYRDLIGEYGFGIVAVFSEHEAWGYTVGLQETYGHPELVLYGLGPDLLVDLFWNAVGLIKAGKPIKPGTPVLGLANVPFEAVKVDEPLDPRYPLSMATNFTTEVQAIQLVWPSAAGYFPWDEGGDTAQAVLGTYEKESA